MSDITIHITANEAVEGGWYQTPRIDENHIPDAAIALVHIQGRGWLLADGQGNVYAEAENPAHLATWLEEFMDDLGAMHQRGEL